jgi:hypothetical protein
LFPVDAQLFESEIILKTGRAKTILEEWVLNNLGLNFFLFFTFFLLEYFQGVFFADMLDQFRMPPPYRDSLFDTIFVDEIFYKSSQSFRVVLEDFLRTLPAVTLVEIPDHIFIEPFSNLRH